MSTFGDPSYALLAWQDEATPGIPNAPAGLRYLPSFAGEGMSNALEALQREAIARSGMRSEPLDGKRTSGGTFKSDALHPEADWFGFSRFIGRSATPELLETGAYRHRLSRLETDVEFPETHTLYAWRNDALGQRFLGCRIGQIQINLAEKALISADHTLVPTFGDYWADGELTGTGTGDLVVLGISDLNFDTADQLLFKVTASDTDSVSVLVKVGSETDWPSDAQVLPRGEKTWLRDHDGVRIGDRADPVTAYPSTTGTFVVDDIWAFDPQRGDWLPVVADPAAVVRETHSSIILDERTDWVITQGTITLAKPTTQRFGFGGRNARETQTRGEQTCEITVQRTYDDLRFRKALERARRIDFRAELWAPGTIGTSGDLAAGFRVICPSCRPSGQTASAKDKNTSDEQVTLAAGVSADPDYPADVTIEVYNTTPSLA